VSISFSTESDADDRFLESRKLDLAQLGIVIERDKGEWHIEALPANWHLESEATIRAILELRLAENILKHWAATLACHAAIKEGEYLNETESLALAEAALALPLPRCPHGRPIWFEMSKEMLYKAVKRV
jgi:DNA mismatch repair protein MutL